MVTEPWVSCMQDNTFEYSEYQWGIRSVFSFHKIDHSKDFSKWNHINLSSICLAYFVWQLYLKFSCVVEWVSIAFRRKDFYDASMERGISLGSENRCALQCIFTWSDGREHTAIIFGLGRELESMLRYTQQFLLRHGELSEKHPQNNSGIPVSQGHWHRGGSLIKINTS